ncbi:MAG: TfuA-related McrA-glycine thioamidation protein [Goleter apudmare HA4340-LM2]|jgi:hypothetical protein|nr:TfuA-related McrA-glycine thioamidation protein [Goleter apudmare HA4340-LM2]
MNTSLSVAVFLGPSLPRNQAHQILDARYYPPASKGDIYQIIASGVQAIILIDGIFHSRPSVWHRELIHAIEEGIQVFGASSMGALRAVELEPFGMVGHGQVFEWYRNGMLESDDEVALLHGAEDSGFVSMSEPLVNIRYTLLKAVEANYLTAEQARCLTDEAKQLYYPQRSYQQLFQSKVIQDLPTESATKLKHYLHHNKINIKQIDAIGVLKLYASLSHMQIAEPRERFSYSSVDLQFERLNMTGFVTSSGLKLGKDILQLLKQDIQLQAKMRSQLSKRCFLLTWARQNQISCPPEYWQTYLQQWQQKYSIVDETQWLQSNGLTPLTYQEILEEYCLIDWIVREGPDYFGIEWNYQTALDAELRLTGDVEPQGNIWEQLSQRRLIVEWARQNGIVHPDTESVSTITIDKQDQVWVAEKILETWIIAKEPEYFGIYWSFPQALFHEWQITGKAAEILQR